jgi:Fe-S-cluster-containing dehydrogenase component/formate-dependent nitrite reductase membrane component NrfD
VELGFVIDHRKCIGCHACTVACKAENEVPLGSFRTWVKYVEKGTFPSVRRHFTVLRCNHCDAAPCVEICPVNALHKRPDAVVDLDRDLCIGCRACMQACPYDALYFNDSRGVAEKCHYCAHRSEVGLEPACVIVCPVQAIVAGDTSDPETPISRLIAEQQTSRRKLEKGTKPRVWYVDALPEALVPSQAGEPEAYLWSQRSPLDEPPPVVPGLEPSPDVNATLDVPHPPVWGAHVWLYLLTKNVAAGAALVAPLLGAFGVRGAARDVVPEVVALAFLALTTLLLVHDLGRPERFWRILLAPNTRSWLVKGGWILTAFGLVTTAALLARLASATALADTLRLANLPLAALASGYSAWLFAQCRGRDLWLERGLFVKLLLRAATAGAALALVLPATGAARVSALHVFAALVAVNAIELAISLRHEPRSVDGRKAQAALRSMLEGSSPGLALVGAAAAAIGLSLLAGALPAVDQFVRIGLVALTLVAMLLHERAWIRAGQAVPLS